MKKQNIKKIITIYIVAAITLSVIIAMSMPSIIRFFSHMSNGMPDIYVFEDIAECEGISELDYSGATVSKHDTPDGDKKLKGLDYESFYAAGFTSDGLKFEIFAYEFADAETAQKYFKNVTGKNVDMERNFSSSTGVLKYRLCVIDGNRAYTITAPNKYTDELERVVIPELFSKKLEP